MEELDNATGRIVTTTGLTIDFTLRDYTLCDSPGCLQTIQIDGINPKVTLPKAFSFNFFDYLIPKDSSLAPFFGFKRDERPAQKWEIDRILKSGPVTIVFWSDGTKTMVRRAPDEEDNTYAAFTAALAIKLFGSNSALKRMLKDKTEVQKPKKKSSGGCTDTCPIDFDAIDKNLQAEKERLNELSEKSHGLTNDA